MKHKAKNKPSTLTSKSLSSSLLLSLYNWLATLNLKKSFVGFILLSGGYLAFYRRNDNNNICESEKLILHRGNLFPPPNWIFIGGGHDNEADVGAPTLTCTEKIAEEFGEGKNQTILVEGVPAGMEINCSRLKIKEQ